MAGYDEGVRKNTRWIFEQTDVFIITLGLSEVWFNKQSGEVFWRAIPVDRFDSDVHGFRVASVAENVENLTAIHELIRRHRPKAMIVFTLSPVPLAATFRPVSCITANAASKAILRAAIDEFMRNREDPGLFYFPAYEIVMHYCESPFNEDNRHPRAAVIGTAMEAFEHAYCRADTADNRDLRT